ncbi:MAG: hypothetical protein ACR2RF_32325 [Geminicoccaceae bacterium]
MPRAKVYDEWAGIRSGWWKDPSTGKNVVVSKQDCGDILDFNKAQQSEGAHEVPGLGKKLASIPVVIFHKWLDDAGITQQQYAVMSPLERKKWLAKHLNDPQWAYLKTTTKRIFAR